MEKERMERCADLVPGTVEFAAEDVDLSVIKVDATGVVLRLWPKISAVLRYMNSLPNAGAWACRHYMCGRAMYCAVGRYSPAVSDYVYRACLDVWCSLVVEE